MASPTKAGSGAGSLLIISSTAATVASPAAYPANPPTPFTVAPTSDPTGIAIGYCKSITLPDQKYNYQTITNLSSPNVNAILGSGSDAIVDEFLPTTISPGEVSATAIFAPTDSGLAALQSAFYSGLANQFQILFAKVTPQANIGNTVAFNAFVQSLPVPTELDPAKDIEYKVSLKLTTLLTESAGN